MTGVPQRPSSPPARMGRDQEPVPGGRPGNRPARAIPAPEPVPRTLATPRHPGGLRPCARSTDHPPPPQPEAAPGTPTGPPSPSTPPPRSPQSPPSLSPSPVPRTHPSPEPAAPRQTSWVSGSGPRTRLQKCPRRRRRRALSTYPTPHFFFLRKRLASLLPRQAEATTTRPSPSPAPAGGTPLRRGRRVAPRPRRECRQRKALGRALPRHPQRCGPPAPDLPLPPERAARLGPPAWAGSGGNSTPGSPGHRRATGAWLPGPAPESGREARRRRPLPKCPSAGSPGGPSPSWPSGKRRDPGTARRELATPHRLLAAAGAGARGGGGPGAGAGGPCGSPGRAVLTAVGDEQAGQDHERPKS